MSETPKAAARRLSRAAIRGEFTPEALHMYTSADGAPLYWRIRARLAAGSKWIRPMRLNGHGYELGEPEFPEGKPLYRLHELAANPGTPVWFVEGENCTDALAKLGVLATTAGSASSDDRADFALLAGRAVTLWPDHDAAGIKHMERVKTKLAALGCTVETLDVKALDLPDKGDAVDWLKVHEGASTADLAILPRVRSASAATTTSKDTSQFVDTVELIDGASIKPEAVRWLWNGYLARGKLHVLAGAPGTGKTMIALALAATVSTGGRWPDGTRCEPGNVLIWSAEDDIADTLAPRLIAMGADMHKISFVGDKSTMEGREPFDPARDMPMLLHTVAGAGEIKLLIVDPIVSAVAGDSHKNAEVRRGLQPLVDVGQKLGAAVLGISHFSKGTAGREVTERVTGSLAFGALARVVLAAAKRSEEDGGGRILARAKSNIGPDGGGFAYDLTPGTVPNHPGIEVHVLQWGNAIEGSARELLASAEDAGDTGERSAADEVASWLDTLLAEEGGQIDRRDVMRAANAMGFKERTVHRARETLGLIVLQTGFGKNKRSVWKHGETSMCANSAHACQAESLANMGILGTHGTIDGSAAVIEVDI